MGHVGNLIRKYWGDQIMKRIVFIFVAALAISFSCSGVGETQEELNVGMIAIIKDVRSSMQSLKDGIIRMEEGVSKSSEVYKGISGDFTGKGKGESAFFFLNQLSEIVSKLQSIPAREFVLHGTRAADIGLGLGYHIVKLIERPMRYLGLDALVIVDEKAKTKSTWGDMLQSYMHMMKNYHLLLEPVKRAIIDSVVEGKRGGLAKILAGPEDALFSSISTVVERSGGIEKIRLIKLAARRRLAWTAVKEVPGAIVKKLTGSEALEGSVAVGLRKLLDVKATAFDPPRKKMSEKIKGYSKQIKIFTKKLVSYIEEMKDNFEEIEEKDILEMAQEAPIVKLVNRILYQAVKEGASDVHIEPYEKELRVRYRIDGVMYQKVLPPKRYQGAIVSRIKIMANLNIAEKRIPQDGRIQIRAADKSLDIRVSVLPCNYGERVVMRLLDKTKGAVDVEKLGLSERDFGILNRIIERPNGIILVTGPTGSGKTTTLYSILGKLNQPDRNIITVEDPVEYTIHGVNQVQVHEKVGLTFAASLRSILRQDPDIVLIGEIRDKETAQISTQAALTGHLVLSTLHTNSAPATITRLIDMGVEPYLIASTLICVVAQRLVRRLCDKCKKQYQPPQEMIERLGLNPEDIGQITFHEPGGCDECLQSGYKGRLPIFEIMEIVDELRPLVVQGADASIIRQKAKELGVTFLLDDGIRRIKEGITSVDEILSVAFAEGKPLAEKVDFPKAPGDEGGQGEKEKKQGEQ